MKFKPKSRTIYKKDDNELFIFKNGIAKVPGMKFKGKQMIITLKEFNKLQGIK